MQPDNALSNAANPIFNNTSICYSEKEVLGLCSLKTYDELLKEILKNEFQKTLNQEIKMKIESLAELKAPHTDRNA